jgi:hypothetical protein
VKNSKSLSSRIKRYAAALAAIVAILLAVPALQLQALADQPDVDLVYVAIGSRHYAETAEATLQGFPEIRAAARSAQRVSEMLSARGASDGVLMTSARDGFVTRRDVFDALDEGIARAQARNDPFLLVYFAGHGLSEGFAWTHISMPGDLVLEKDADGQPILDLDRAASTAIIASELADYIGKTGLPYLLILDTCYEGGDVELTSYQEILGNEVSNLVSNMADILRFMNQFRQESPVVFSTSPGNIVRTSFDPASPQLGLAPLARRLLLLETDPGPLILSAILNQLTGKDRDIETEPGVSFAEPSSLSGRRLLGAPSRAGPDPLKLTGSATASQACCRPATPAALQGDEDSYRAVLELSGPEGEYVSGGVSHKSAIGATSIAAYQPGEVSVLIWPEEGAAWSADFSSGTGSPFREGDEFVVKPGSQAQLDVWGDGRGCSEISGAFSVEDARYDETGLIRLEVRFLQHCDGGAEAAEGRLILERT